MDIVHSGTFCTQTGTKTSNETFLYAGRVNAPRCSIAPANTGPGYLIYESEHSLIESDLDLTLGGRDCRY